MKNKIRSITFCGLLCAVLLVNLFTPDKALSYSERRKLAQKPAFDKEFFLGGKAEALMEAYLLDQFAGRDSFRTLKALMEMGPFAKKDNNGIYVRDGVVFKTLYPMDPDSVQAMAAKIDAIYKMYLQDCNVAVGIIPSKDVFASKEAGHLGISYEEMEDTFLQALKETKSGENIQYLDFKAVLNLEAYYNTDLHWKQEELSGVMELLAHYFGFDPLPITAYEEKTYEPFYGAYYGQSALKLPADRLTYLWREGFVNCKVTNYDESGNVKEVIYDEEKLGSIDSYEVFLSGNSPLITLENPNSTSEKELIVFRDSFGSSLAPLLLDSYSKITLVDLRFMPYANLQHFVEFKNQDVLFMYGMEVMNSSAMIR